MAIKIGKGATRALGFQLRVQKLNIHHSRAKVSLAAIPIAPFFEPHAAFLGSIKDHKITTKRNKSLKRVLKEVDWDRSKLKPLKDLLRAKLVEGRRHPDRLIAILKTTLSHDCTPNFKVKFSPSNHSISPQQALRQALIPMSRTLPSMCIEEAHFYATIATVRAIELRRG